MLKIPINLIKSLVDDLVSCHYTLLNLEEEEGVREAYIYDIKLMQSNEINYFIGTCLLNIDDTTYDTNGISIIYTIDFLALRLLDIIYEDEEEWTDIITFNEKGLELFYVSHESSKYDSSYFISFKDFSMLFITPKNNYLNWTEEFTVIYENYITRLLKKYVLFGLLNNIDIISLHSAYSECYGHNLSTLYDLEKQWLQVKEEIHTMHKNYPTFKLLNNN
jgi:hypothetical protein